MNDVSSFGLLIRIIASRTFPGGFNVSQFADDADPLAIPSIQVRDKAMGSNGDLIVWSKANPILISLAVIPNSEDDRNLAVLFESNRVGKGKQGSRDIITMIGIYPDGSSIQLQQGAVTDGMPGRGVVSAGRLQTPVYQFAFENMART